MEQEYPWLVEEKNKIKEFVVNLEKLFRVLSWVSITWRSNRRKCC